MQERFEPKEIIGHGKQRKSLKDLCVSKHLPSTMLFAGASGIGKKLLAIELARTLLCHDSGPHTHTAYGGCSTCKSCRLLNSGNHPDFYLIQCLERSESSVESLRERMYALNLNPFASKCRVVIFDNAEHLSLQAANILLKSLEEPRPGTFYILVCSAQSKLPPTLLSRCQIWHFDALSKQQIEVLISREQSDEISAYSSEQIKDLALLADGSMENISNISHHLELWTEVRTKLDALFGGQEDLAVEWSQDLAKKKTELRLCLHLMRIYSRDRLRSSQSAVNLNIWAKFLSNILSTERYIFERNLSAAGVLLVAFFSLSKEESVAQASSFLPEICV